MRLKDAPTWQKIGCQPMEGRGVRAVSLERNGHDLPGLGLSNYSRGLVNLFWTLAACSLWHVDRRVFSCDNCNCLFSPGFMQRSRAALCAGTVDGRRDHYRLMVWAGAESQY
jgi:hypothetical protein